MLSAVSELVTELRAHRHTAVNELRGHWHDEEVIEETVNELRGH